MITSGNAIVVVAAEPDPCVAIAFAEVLATSDVPGGVVNVLTGSAAEVGPHLAAHADVNALDLTGVDAGAADGPRAEGGRDGEAGVRAARSGRLLPSPGLARLRAFVEIKTIWHPTGALSLSGGSAY